jgi:hypothetical protein
VNPLCIYSPLASYISYGMGMEICFFFPSSELANASSVTFDCFLGP